MAQPARNHQDGACHPRPARPCPATCERARGRGGVDRTSGRAGPLHISRQQAGRHPVVGGGPVDLRRGCVRPADTVQPGIRCLRLDAVGTAEGDRAIPRSGPCQHLRPRSCLFAGRHPATAPCGRTGGRAGQHVRRPDHLRRRRHHRAGQRRRSAHTRLCCDRPAGAVGADRAVEPLTRLSGR